MGMRVLIRMTRDIENYSSYSVLLFVSVFSILFCMYFILCGDIQSLSLVYVYVSSTRVFHVFVCMVLCSILLCIRIKHDEGVVLPTCSLTIGSQLLTYSSITLYYNFIFE